APAQRGRREPGLEHRYATLALQGGGASRGEETHRSVAGAPKSQRTQRSPGSLARRKRSNSSVPNTPPNRRPAVNTTTPTRVSVTASVTDVGQIARPAESAAAMASDAATTLAL